MQKLFILIAVLLAACTTAEDEVLTTSVDIDQSDIAALLGDIDLIAENALAVGEMLELAVSTPMDEEQQGRFTLTFKGTDEEIQFHVWREQVDWVHLYFSSTSTDLIAALEMINVEYARDDDS